MLTNVGESHGSDPSVLFDSPGTLIVIGGVRICFHLRASIVPRKVGNESLRGCQT